jgi:RNA polymerase sigma-70 factor (ECF subfamily)
MSISTTIPTRLPRPASADEGSALDARQMLASLPERQRRIVEGISIEGQSARDVGSRMGMSEGAVRVTLHRALRALAVAYRKDRT